MRKAKLAIYLYFIATILTSCLVTRPVAKDVSNVNKRKYIEVQEPHYQKKVNFVGGLFNLSLVGGGAYYGYQYQVGNKDQQYLYAAGGAAGGYILSRLFLRIAGNKKRTHLNSTDQLAKWVQDYNQWKNTDWSLVSHPNLSLDGIRVLPRTAENVFVPSSLYDVRSFASAFPASPHLNRVIDSANRVLDRPSLKEMINLFPTQSAVLRSKITFVEQSSNEQDFAYSIKLFPETERYVEEKYANMIRTFPYAKDFIERYPGSIFSSNIFKRVYSSTENPELEILLDLYSTVDTATMRQARHLLYNRYGSIDMLLAKLKKYNDNSYFIKPTDSYESFDEAFGLYTKLNSSTTPHQNTTELIGDLKYQFLKKQLYYAKGNMEETRFLFKEIRSVDWVKGEKSNVLINEIISEYCQAFGEEYFTGKKGEAGAQGHGVLYRKNGDIEFGEFEKNKLNGDGRIIGKNKDVYEGYFLNGELNGEGKTISQNGRIVQGHFIKGDLNGVGQISFKNGAYEKGIYNMNRLMGSGERHFEDSSYYEGNFSNGRFEGEGIFYWKEGGAWFQGSFANGKRDGMGKLYLSGYTISGNWKNDCPEGEMTIRKDSQNEASNSTATFVVKDCGIVSWTSDYPSIQIDEKILFSRVYTY